MRLNDVVGRTMSAESGGLTGVDPATIILVIQTLISLYHCFHDNPKRAAVLCNTPLLSRVMLNRAIRKAVPDVPGETKKRLANALLAAGDGVTPEDVAAIVADAGANKLSADSAGSPQG